MRLEEIEALDRPAAALAKFHGAYQKGALKSLLRGDWLGHSVHPVLTGIPIGTWTSAMLLDVLGADEDAATALVFAGVAAVGPAALTGWSDWHDEEARSPAIRRVGIVHAGVNGTAAALQLASVSARRSGSRGRGAALSATAMVLVGVGGWLGGHLTYNRGSRVEPAKPTSAGPQL